MTQLEVSHAQNNRIMAKASLSKRPFLSKFFFIIVVGKDVNKKDLKDLKDLNDKGNNF